MSVRPKTRQRVLQAAERLAYRPHAGARGLRRAETGALGLVIPDLSMPIYARIARGAFRRALEKDYVLLLVEDLEPLDVNTVFERLVDSGRIDGLIVASARPRHPLLTPLRRSGVPHVFANRGVPRSGRNVILEDSRASETALAHLVALGHRRIGHVAGPKALDPARRRADAFIRGAKAFGLSSAPVVEGAFTEVGGAEAARTLLTTSPDVTAIYAASLAQAVGVLGSLWDLNLRVPHDVSVVAHDDMPLADFLRPPLTTIRMPLAELGAAAVDALVDQLEGGTPANSVVAAEPEVVVRASTSGPRR